MSISLRVIHWKNINDSSQLAVAPFSAILICGRAMHWLSSASGSIYEEKSKKPSMKKNLLEQRTDFYVPAPQFRNPILKTMYFSHIEGREKNVKYKQAL